ncbi:hypothetical protein [Methylorubrum thiocyanatum]|uniref:Uncharacterized protein n=1 Tax=Methylorubrum thiocyanatum TaxID=47958 RepID=A0AA40S0F2_9HYPH|nr:hypothetical protein [Methylorubrum thiocyanatum]MBA8912088.1 hypothetical protein [Methylorubrum thiocyanatum]GJE79619.1 hypothetical protein CJNNKLLH_0945 [Methylorubrum thiocyanatum]
MAETKKTADVEAPDRPRLTPQGHSSGTSSEEDSTDPRGGAKEGQSDKAEGE